MTMVDIDPRRVCLTAPRCFAGVGTAVVAASLLTGCGANPFVQFEESMATEPAAPSASANASAAELIQARRDAFPIDHDMYRELGYRLDWRGFPVVQTGESIDFLDLYDDVIIAHESGATISVLEASNGALRNSTQVDSPLTRFLGNVRLDDNTIVVSSDNEAVIMDLETGSMLDRQPLSRVVTTHPVVTGGHKVYGTAIGHVYAHRLNPPVDSWAFDMASPVDTDQVLVGSVVVSVARNGSVTMIDVPTGTLVGNARIFGGCEAAPVAGENAVFLASLDQSIYCFDLRGQQRWRIRTEQPLRVTPTYHAGVLYVPSDDLGLRAIDTLTGAGVWEQREVEGRVVGVRDGRLLTWDGQQVSTLDAATGDIIVQATLPGVDILKPDQFVDGNLYAVSAGGVVAKFQPRD